MKVRYNPARNLQFEIDGSTQKEIFGSLAAIDEVFTHEPCGVCDSDDTCFLKRTVDDNDYYERKCNRCGAKLAYGQNKTGGTLFPKRKIAQDDGTEVFDKENLGWFKWVPDPDKAKSNPKKK